MKRTGLLVRTWGNKVNTSRITDVVDIYVTEQGVVFNTDQEMEMRIDKRRRQISVSLDDGTYACISFDELKAIVRQAAKRKIKAA